MVCSTLFSLLSSKLRSSDELSLFKSVLMTCFSDFKLTFSDESILSDDTAVSDMFEASTSAVSNIPCDPDTVFTDVVCDCNTAVVVISDILRSFCTVAAVVSVAPIFSDAIVAAFSDALMVSDVPMASVEAVFTSPGLSGSVKISSSCGFSSTSIFETASSNA